MRTLRVEDLGLALVQHHFLIVPPASLEEQSVDISAVLRFQIRCFLHELEIVSDLVDGNRVLSREVLKDTSEETLREEEARNPEDSWIADIYPSLEEGKPSLEISHIRSQRFQRRIALAHPKIWYFSVEERLRCSLEGSIHDNLTHHCQFDVLEG